ncbi:MAG: hypothetical protein HOV79_27775 [Hamadaea sp.]|nr:hypothetical protein [Hamadaea sp.]
MTLGAVKAPLLAVVGGPTGAGKSTLLNSLVRAPVSAAGVLRPTTRQPVLVCNPRDWATVRRHGLRPICSPLMPEGMSLVDLPDRDSIGETNLAATDQILAAADLWLFVTTPSRYADATAWRQLRAARERRVALGILLDRVPAGSAPDIIDHMRDLLGPPEPPLFVIPDVPLDRQGMLPDDIVAPLRGWLAAVVAGPPREPQFELTPAGHEITTVAAPGAAAAYPEESTGGRVAEGAGDRTDGGEGVVQSTTSPGDLTAGDQQDRSDDSDGQPVGRPEEPAADIPQGADVGETVTL